MARNKRKKSSKLLAPLHEDRHDSYFHKKRTLKISNRQTYGHLVRRTILFQFRLAADNIRDLLLSPIAVVAALLGLLRPDNPSWALDRLMMFGRATDRWINLFEDDTHTLPQQSSETLDDFLGKVETRIKTKLDPETPADEATWAKSFSAYYATRQSQR
ncbi:hypothetical protein [uncultured Cohaesibacter sp.]|uniref:hypothetical protein n=1 Tax=uncultured Cohaesibacter sp. TaxID=1002546 RepID=UPI00292F0084|nr:hypothetical protein [uncultured Cohaesibacter sp.]